MKANIFLFGFFIFLISCNDTAPKPDNLIGEDQMIDIIYDLTILDGIKSHNPQNLQSFNQNNFIYKKYKIDSLQFAKSNQFYASDIHKYKKMYREVNERIEKDQKRVDSLALKSSSASTTPPVADDNDKPIIK